MKKHKFKFRFWDKEKRNYNNSDYYVANHGIYSFYDFYGNKTGRKDCSKRVTVEKYVGVKDKNGKEIYEGDIVLLYDYYEDFYFQAEVKWSNELKQFMFVELGENNNSFEYYITSYQDNIKVIGNIHENEDLYKPSKS